MSCSLVGEHYRLQAEHGWHRLPSVGCCPLCSQRFCCVAPLVALFQSLQYAPLSSPGSWSCRVAQLGFAAGLIGEAITGKGILAQFDLETGLPLYETEPLLLAL